MGDRGTPRSYRMMEGFGVHTFRLSNADGETSLVKFHWKPTLGVHSLTWEEAQLLGGNDPDFHRRDLAEAIESGAHPTWELGIQVFPDNEEQSFEGIDLLDPTKFVPEELAPVQPVGRLTLDRNPSNYFAETEQVAFNPGHLVPGIDVTDDPLLQVRLFSYVDTQLTRLGGPNFAQLPVNRAHAPVNDMLRDGYGQQGDHAGVAPYHPNSLDGGCPFMAGEADAAFEDLPVRVPEGVKERELSATFEDHYSQPRLFWRSMTPVEQDHIVDAYSFELGKCYENTIKERQLQCLANIDGELCARVAAALGMPAPEPTVAVEDGELASSAPLSQLGGSWPADGRTVGIVVDPDADNEGLLALHEAIVDASMTPLVIAPRGGEVAGVPVGRTFGTAASVEPRVGKLIDECWRHSKAIGAWGPGREALEARTAPGGAGLVVGDDAQSVLGEITPLLQAHRVWERFPAAL